MTTSAVQVGIIITHSQSAPREALADVARQLVQHAAAELEKASGRSWNFQFGDPLQLGSDERRHAGHFLGAASLRLIEDSLDLVVILTDVAIISRRERIVFGLASPLARTVILPTHRLREGERGKRLDVECSPSSLQRGRSASAPHRPGAGREDSTSRRWSNVAVQT